jgi:uncharacterized protein (TIGR02246 family)
VRSRFADRGAIDDDRTFHEGSLRRQQYDLADSLLSESSSLWGGKAEQSGGPHPGDLLKELAMPTLQSTSPILVAGVLLAGAVVPTPLRAQAPAPEADAAIRAVVQKYVDAREARDAKAIEPLFTADADQLVSDGTWRRGRDELVRGMLESSRRTGGRRSIAVESVRLLSPDVAVADGRYKQTGLAGGADREMWTTLLLKREPDGWRIAGIRNMLPAAPEAATKR